jgi:hypothetical protein
MVGPDHQSFGEFIIGELTMPSVLGVEDAWVLWVTGKRLARLGLTKIN